MVYNLMSLDVPSNNRYLLMRNTNTGAFEIYDIANNQLSTVASMGQVGPSWPVAGIAAA